VVVWGEFGRTPRITRTPAVKPTAPSSVVPCWPRGVRNRQVNRETNRLAEYAVKLAGDTPGRSSRRFTRALG